MSDIEQEKEYWANRARNYSKLEWASRHNYLDAVVQAGDPQPGDFVLDVGTGTGLVAEAVLPRVSRVIGVDISPEMMNGLKSPQPENCKFQLGDIRCLEFPSEYFTKVFARMVFHSLMASVDQAAQECYRVLKDGGKFVLSEGTPPAKEAGDWYTEMFRLKEERLTIFPETLEDLLARAGFSDIKTRIHISPQVSIRNWLENSGLPESTQNQIMEVHLAMPAPIRGFYDATFTDDGDVLVDMKFAIVVGTKA